MADVLKLQTLDGMLDYPSAEDTSKGTTEQQFQEYLKNQHSVISDMVAVTLWQPSTTYVVGQVIFSPNMPANTCARVVTAGTTGAAEPAWGAIGSTMSDGTVAYVMMHRTIDFATQEQAIAGTDNKTIITPAMLKAVLDAWIVNTYPPVGTVLSFADDTDPNKIWKHTKWEKFGEGRVLIGAGTYTEDGTTYTYKVGDTGGEAMHQLTTDEMPKHTHDGIISSNGEHFHTMARGNDVNDKQALASYMNTNHYLLTGGTSSGKTALSGNHSHNIEISKTGNGVKFNNCMPYKAVYRWRRVF